MEMRNYFELFTDGEIDEMVAMYLFTPVGFLM